MYVEAKTDTGMIVIARRLESNIILHSILVCDLTFRYKKV